MDQNQRQKLSKGPNSLLFKPEGSNIGERILSSVAAFGFSRHHQRIELRSKTGPGVEILQQIKSPNPVSIGKNFL